jgi:hypothetical protein
MTPKEIEALNRNSAALEKAHAHRPGGPLDVILRCQARFAKQFAEDPLLPDHEIERQYREARGGTLEHTTFLAHCAKAGLKAGRMRKSDIPKLIIAGKVRRTDVSDRLKADAAKAKRARRK